MSAEVAGDFHSLLPTDMQNKYAAYMNKEKPKGVTGPGTNARVLNPQ